MQCIKAVFFPFFTNVIWDQSRACRKVLHLTVISILCIFVHFVDMRKKNSRHGINFVF